MFSRTLRILFLSESSRFGTQMHSVRGFPLCFIPSPYYLLMMDTHMFFCCSYSTFIITHVERVMNLLDKIILKSHRNTVTGSRWVRRWKWLVLMNHLPTGENLNKLYTEHVTLSLTTLSTPWGGRVTNSYSRIQFSSSGTVRRCGSDDVPKRTPERTLPLPRHRFSRGCGFVTLSTLQVTFQLPILLVILIVVFFYDEQQIKREFFNFRFGGNTYMWVSPIPVTFWPGMPHYTWSPFLFQCVVNSLYKCSPVHV